MSDENPVSEEKFNTILRRMLMSKPLSKAEISARIATERDAKKARVFEEYKKRREYKKSG